MLRREDGSLYLLIQIRWTYFTSENVYIVWVDSNVTIETHETFY